MMRTILMGLVLALPLAGPTALRAAEPDELRDKAKAIQEEIGALLKEGLTQAAEQLEREARKLIQEADRREARPTRETPRPEIENEIAHLRDRLKALRAKQKTLARANAPDQEQAELREQIARTDLALANAQGRLVTNQSDGPDVKGQARALDEAARRIHHIRVAAENLEAAGLHDLAVKLSEQAATMEHDAREAKARMAAERERAGGDSRDAALQDLKEQNERLQTELRELRQKLERR